MARTIFANGLLFDGVNPVRPGVSIVVEGARVVEVTQESVRTARDDQIFDLGGRTLMPGLGIAHFHAEYDWLSINGIAGGVYLGMAKPPGYVYAVAISTLGRAVRSGVTSIVGAGCSYDIDATLKMAIEDGKIDGPRIFPGSRHLDSTGNENDWAPWWYDLGKTDSDGNRVAGSERFCDGPDAFRKATRQEIKRGARMIKTFMTGGHGFDVDGRLRSMSLDELSAVIETAHERGALVRGHVCGRQAILECIAAGMDVIDHGDEIDDEIIAAMVSKGTYLVPSVLFLKRAMGAATGSVQGSTLDTPASRSFENMVKMLPKAQAAGVRIVPGDDYGLDFMPHDEPGIYGRELEIYVKDCGISAREVLSWSTVNVAALIGRSHDLGRIDVGMLADLLVVRGNPTADIGILSDPDRNLDAVMVSGRFLRNRIADAATSVAIAAE